MGCDNGDSVCDPLIANNAYHGPKGLFIHSPEDTLTLKQQGEEMTCRLNGVRENECNCVDYYKCPCLEDCLGDDNSNAYFSSNVSGTHFGVLSTEGLANVTRDFICS